MTLPRALDRDAFKVFIECIPCPTLVPGQIVIADNRSAHKSQNVQQMIEEAGCSRVHLPPLKILWLGSRA